MTRTQQVKAFNSLAACSDGAGKRRRRGAGCNFFALNFQLFSATLSERGRGRKRERGKVVVMVVVWGGENGIPQRRSHIFQHYNMLSAVPGLRSETHSRSSTEKKVSGKNFAGTPSWSSRDVFIRRREPGVSLCRHKSTSQKRISGGGGGSDSPGLHFAG